MSLRLGYWWLPRDIREDLIEQEAAIRELQRDVRWTLSAIQEIAWYLELEVQRGIEKAVQTVPCTAAGVAGTDPETSGLREED